VARVALGHHVGRLEHRVGDLSDGKLLVVGLFSRDNWSVGAQHKVNTWVWHQVGLELSDINVQGTIETKGSSERGDDLGNQPVQVGVSWALNVEVTAAHIVESLVIKAEGDISVLKESVGRKDRVVWLDDSSGDLWGRRHSEGELGLAAVIYGETLKEESTKTRSGTTTSGVEHEETLETGTVVSQLTDTVENKVDNLLTDGVVTTGVVVGSVLLTGDDLLRVVELTVGTGTDFVTHRWLKIDVLCTWPVLSRTSLRDKGVESIVTASDGLVGWHLTIRLDTVLETVELPATVTSLDTGLTNVDGDGFTHD
jgi:hypothetical protein